MNTETEQCAALIRQVSDFLTVHRSQIVRLYDSEEVVSRFLVQTSGFFVMSEHLQLVLKGIALVYPDMKLSLCRHVYEIAGFLLRFSENSELTREIINKRPGIKQLFNARNHNLLKYCNRVIAAAERQQDVFRNHKINPEIINTLRTARDMYNSIVPPPRAYIAKVEALRATVKRMEERMQRLLNKEIAPTMKNISKKSPLLYKKFLQIMNPVE